MPVRPDVVAVLNTSPDVVDLLRLSLERAGIIVVSALTYEIREGTVNLQAFIEQHQPKAIVYDIAPPYDANWQLFQHTQRMPFMADRYFVLTATHKQQVARYAGAGQRIYEIIGKPFDLDEIVQAVREALKARPVHR